MMPYDAPARLPEPSVYLVRRACRLGLARRKDMTEHFDGSISTQTRWIRQALDAAPCLAQDGAGAGSRIVLSQPEKIPAWASASALLLEIENGNQPQVTGLEDHELPVFIPNWTSNQPLDPQALPILVKAIAMEKGVRIQYVGLRRDERGRWRSIYPMGLERMGDQWRLVGLDLEQPEFPLRVFVLARILSVEPTLVPLPKGFSKPGIHDATVILKARLNPDLTPDQALAVLNEMGIRDGKIAIHRRTLFEYCRRFGQQKTSRDAVWPPLMNTSEDCE